MFYNTVSNIEDYPNKMGLNMLDTFWNAQSIMHSHFRGGEEGEVLLQRP